MGRLVASLDCHIELRTAQPRQAGSSLDTSLPQLPQGAQEQREHSFPLLSSATSHLPWAVHGAQTTPHAGCGSSWETPAQVTLARGLSLPCAGWRKLCALGRARAGDEPCKFILEGNNCRGTGACRTRQKSLTRTRFMLHEPQADLIHQRIQVWSLEHTERWLKADSKIRPSSFCFKERHSNRSMR